MNIVGTIKDLKNKSDMTAIINSKSPVAVMLLGYQTPGDGGGGHFYWDNESTETDNGGTVIAHSSVKLGRWKRIFDGPLSICWFGAKTDDATICTNAIRKTINAAKLTKNRTGGSNAIFIPQGYYLISDTIDVPSGTSITGNGRGNSIIKPASGITAFKLDGAENCTIKDLSIHFDSYNNNNLGILLQGFTSGITLSGLGIWSKISPSGKGIWCRDGYLGDGNWYIESQSENGCWYKDISKGKRVFAKNGRSNCIYDCSVEVFSTGVHLEESTPTLNTLPPLNKKLPFEPTTPPYRPSGIWSIFSSRIRQNTCGIEFSGSVSLFGNVIEACVIGVKDASSSSALKSFGNHYENGPYGGDLKTNPANMLLEYSERHFSAGDGFSGPNKGDPSNVGWDIDARNDAGIAVHGGGFHEGGIRVDNGKVHLTDCFSVRELEKYLTFYNRGSSHGYINNLFCRQSTPLCWSYYINGNLADKDNEKESEKGSDNKKSCYENPVFSLGCDPGGNSPRLKLEINKGIEDSKNKP